MIEKTKNNMKPNKIELSIIIVSYNNQTVLINCLESIIKHNDLSDQLQVIIVEQSPQDDIFQYLLNKYHEFEIIRAENHGFGAGNNIGAERARGNYLLFLNPDTILVEPIGLFAKQCFDSNSNLGMFGVQLLNGERNITSSFECINPYGYKAKVFNSIFVQKNKFKDKSMYIQGADIFIRKDLFERIGKFDENIFMYFEESDLSLRILKEGYQIRFFDSKRIIHLQGACSSKEITQLVGRQIASYKYFCQKHTINYKKFAKQEIKIQKLKMLFQKTIKKNEKEEYCVAKGIAETIALFLQNDENENERSLKKAFR